MHTELLRMYSYHAVFSCRFPSDYVSCAVKTVAKWLKLRSSLLTRMPNHNDDLDAPCLFVSELVKRGGELGNYGCNILAEQITQTRLLVSWSCETHWTLSWKLLEKSRYTPAGWMSQ